jgi:uncharacterized protein with LGFP repeats
MKHANHASMGLFALLLAPAAAGCVAPAGDEPVAEVAEAQVCNIYGPVADKWNALGGATGFLGNPLADEQWVFDGAGRFGTFEGGSVYYTPVVGAFEVHGPIQSAWTAVGAATGTLGYPTSDVTALGDKVGSSSTFQGGRIYHSPATGAKVLYGPIADKYVGLGETTSYLGYPTSTITMAPGAFGAEVATFENGYIYYTPSAGAVDFKGTLPSWSTILGSPY